MTTHAPAPSTGELLRHWRQRRRLSQLDLSNRAAVSTRHLSFVENGRSRPSRELVLHLAQTLAVPLRDQNRMLLAAGHAPAYSDRPLDATESAAVREALVRVLRAHEPNPALLVDGRWNVVELNAGAAVFAMLADPCLLVPPINVMRLTFRPEGLAGRLKNFAEVGHHSWMRLLQQADATGDAELADLIDELRPFAPAPPSAAMPSHQVVLPLVFDGPTGELRLFTTIATLGAPLDATLADLALEAFYPADADSALRLRRLVEGAAAPPAG
ncbi:MAG: helix-turn-helix transcriptional regulator [Acidimicrobiia bacterium]|nr:helix-turn-helix transcriptional regulator [Acidimicrobiia bacterium]